MTDFADFDRYCDQHDIKPGEEPAAFAAWLHEASGGSWDGPMSRVDQGRPVTTPETFYLLACLECGNPDRPLPMPFGSPAERGKWASGHTRATGHSRWWVKDEERRDG